MGVYNKMGGASSHGDQSNLSRVPVVRQIHRKISYKNLQQGDNYRLYVITNIE